MAAAPVIANKVRSDYDPILAPCMAELVETRRLAGENAPKTISTEVKVCEDMKNPSNSGWGTFLENGNFDKHILLGQTRS